MKLIAKIEGTESSGAPRSWDEQGRPRVYKEKDKETSTVVEVEDENENENYEKEEDLKMEGAVKNPREGDLRIGNRQVASESKILTEYCGS